MVTADFAGLWVDSRYWVQAEAQLAGTGVQLMKIALATTPGHVDWLAANTRAGQRIGVDGQVLGLAAFRALSAAAARRAPRWRSAPTCWTTSGKAAPACRTHASTNTSRRRLASAAADKLAQVREAMRKHGADAHFISTLDDIAWLFNLRGAGVDYNPVFVGHALVGLDYATLFVAEGRWTRPCAVLAADGVDVAGYAQPRRWARWSWTRPADRPARVTCGVFHAMNPDVPRVEAINPSTLLKSRKTEAELANVRQAMEQDGAALCEFFAWFEGALGKERITELTIDEQITAARARRPAMFVPASPPSPVSTPTAPCRITAPPPNRTP